MENMPGNTTDSGMGIWTESFGHCKTQNRDSTRRQISEGPTVNGILVGEIRWREEEGREPLRGSCSFRPRGEESHSILRGGGGPFRRESDANECETCQRGIVPGDERGMGRDVAVPYSWYGRGPPPLHCPTFRG